MILWTHHAPHGSCPTELQGEADRLRRAAEACADLAERERLLRKARSREVAAEAERWANSPGLAGPRPLQTQNSKN